MKHQERVKLIKAAVRVSNWVGRQDVESFARRHGTMFDKLIGEALPEAVGRRVTRRLLHWSDLRPQVQDRLMDRMGRQRARGRDFSEDNPYIAWGIMGGDGTVQQHWRRVRSWGRMPVKDQAPFINKTRPKKEGTLPERLHEERLRTLRALFHLGWESFDAEFVPGLHPDDVESSSALPKHRLVVAREFRTLSEMFHQKRGWDDKARMAIPERKEPVVAADLFLRDRADRVEVWYVAALHEHRRGPPSVEQCFIGRAQSIDTGEWQFTGRFKAARGALAAANVLYGNFLAAALTKEEGDA